MTNPQIAHAIWPILRKLARDQQTMTYGELATLVKPPAHFLRAPLTLIHAESDDRGGLPSTC